MPQDYPSQFGRSDAYSNPEGMLPMPPPASTSWPAPQWFTQKISFTWELVATIDGTDPDEVYPTGWLYRYVWNTATFDLRPDLRSGNASPKDGIPMLSPAARLMLQLTRSANGTASQPLLSSDGLYVEAVDWVNNVTNYSSDRRTADGGITGGAGLIPGNAVNVTSQFTTVTSTTPTGYVGARSVLVGFAPPGTNLGGGDGYPVRFWRLELRFNMLVRSELPLPDPPTEPPALVLQASMY